MGRSIPAGDSRARYRAAVAAPAALAAIALVAAAGLWLRASGGGPLAVDRWWHDLAGLGPDAPMLGLALLLHHLGGRTGAALCIAVAALAFLATRHLRAAGAIATAGLLGVGASNALKALVGRARPEDALVHEHSFSYPSGHSMGAAALAVSLVLALAGAQRVSRGVVRWAAVGAAAWILTMMWSRTALDAHWLSDTVAGALLGASAAVLAWALWSALAPLLRYPPQVGDASTRPPLEGNDP